VVAACEKAIIPAKTRQQLTAEAEAERVAMDEASPVSKVAEHGFGWCIRAAAAQACPG
jgi:hypothetical protein